MGLIAGYTYERNISFTAVSATYDTIIVNLSPSNFNYSRCDSAGDDIRFGQDANDLYPYWIKTWDISATSTIHVRIPSPAITSMSMWYGNASAVKGSNCNKTFPIGFDFSEPSGATDLWSDTDYNLGFSNLLELDSDHMVYSYRGQATDHTSTDGKSCVRIYTKSTATWGSEIVIYELAGHRVDSGGMGVVSGDLFIFSTVRNSVTFEDIGCTKCTWDGTTLTVGTFTPVTIDARYDTTLGYLPYGNIMEYGGDHYMFMYGGITGGDFLCKFLKSTDGCNTWSDDAEIYTGAAAYTEGYCVNIGSGKVIILIRQDSASGLFQITTDDMSTFTAPALTNLTTFGDTQCYIEFDTNLYVVYRDRLGNKVLLSISDPATVYADETAYTTPILIHEYTVGTVNYCAICKIDTGRYFILWTEDTATSPVVPTGLIYPGIQKLGVTSVGNRIAISSGVGTVPETTLYLCSHAEAATIGRSLTFRAKMANNTTLFQECGMSTRSTFTDAVTQDLPNAAHSFCIEFYTSGALYSVTSDGVSLSSGLDSFDTSYHVYKLTRNTPTNCQFTIDGSTLANTPLTGNLPTTDNMRLAFFARGTGTAEYDYAYLTNTVENVGSVGVEKTPVNIVRLTGAGPTATTITGANTRCNLADSHTSTGQTNGIPIPDAGTNFSYWVTTRLTVDATLTGTINNIKWYTDGTNSLGAGVTVVGYSAGSYVQATGSGDSGTELTQANHAGLSASATDIFTFTVGGKLSISGSRSGGIGQLGNYVVYQARVGSTASLGASQAETITWMYDES